MQSTAQWKQVVTWNLRRRNLSLVCGRRPSGGRCCATARGEPPPRLGRAPGAVLSSTKSSALRSELRNRRWSWLGFFVRGANSQLRQKKGCTAAPLALWASCTSLLPLAMGPVLTDVPHRPRGGLREDRGDVDLHRSDHLTQTSHRLSSTSWRQRSSAILDCWPQSTTRRKTRSCRLLGRERHSAKRTHKRTASHLHAT